MANLYDVELWYRGQSIVGEIREMTDGLKWKKTLNGVYEIDFTVNYKKFEKFCGLINEDPEVVIKPLVTDVRLKRKGQYVRGMGCNVIEAPLETTESGEKIRVSADGFLNLLERYVTKDYKQKSSQDITWDLIDTTQKTVGSLGITRGVAQATSQLRDKTYEDSKVSEALVNLTNYASRTHEFEFSYDRKYNTYDYIGSARPDVVIVYPSKAGNVIDQSAGQTIIAAKSFVAPRNGSGLYNRIIAKGSGFGDTTIRTVGQNTNSQTEFFTREKVSLWNGVSETSTLQEHADGEVLLVKDLYNLPKLELSGVDFFKTGLDLGDRVYCVQNKLKYGRMDGFHRIVQIECSVDKDDKETVTLTMDNFKVKPDGTME